MTGLDTAECTKLLSFHVGSGLFGIAAETVRHIIPAVDLHDDELLPDEVAGSTIIDGHPYPVVDLRVLLGHEVRTIFGMCIVLIEIQGSSIGLLVDGIGSITEAKVEDRMHSSILEDAERTAFCCLGFVRLDGQLCEILDLDMIVPDPAREACDNWRRTQQSLHHMASSIATEGSSEDEVEPDPEAQKISGRYLIIHIGDGVQAIQSAQVVEILPARGIVKIPCCAAEFQGLLPLRGSIHPVLDLATRLEGDSPSKSTSDVLVLVRDHEGVTALRTGPPIGLRNILASELSVGPNKELSIHEDLYLGTTQVEGKNVPLLNMQRILDDDRVSLREVYTRFVTEHGTPSSEFTTPRPS